MSDSYYFSGRLKQKLEQITEYPLTVIEADSGYGKTTAVYECVLKQNTENCVQMTYSCLGEPAAAAWKGICSELAATVGETAAVSRENCGLKEKIFHLARRYRRGRDVILNALNVTNKILTPREREIAGLLKIRLSVKEIAEKLFISSSTVSNIMQSIYSKLDIHSKRELYFREDI